MDTEAKKTGSLARPERLASAIYLITSFFVDLEPMKWRLRELASRLIERRDSRITLVPEIMSLLSVSKNAGLISEMNYGIISKELENMLPEPLRLGEMFKETEGRERERAESKPQIYLSSSMPASGAIKDKKKETEKDISVEDKDGVIAIKRNSRQSTIINLLRRKGEIMIKDVSPLIEGVSEKTIQRELLDLVAKGVLRKIGEKRWSRYTLAD